MYPKNGGYVPNKEWVPKVPTLKRMGPYPIKNGYLPIPFRVPTVQFLDNGMFWSALKRLEHGFLERISDEHAGDAGIAVGPVVADAGDHEGFVGTELAEGQA